MLTLLDANDGLSATLRKLSQERDDLTNQVAVLQKTVEAMRLERDKAVTSLHQLQGSRAMEAAAKQSMQANEAEAACSDASRWRRDAKRFGPSATAQIAAMSEAMSTLGKTGKPSPGKVWWHPGTADGYHSVPFALFKPTVQFSLPQLKCAHAGCDLALSPHTWLRQGPVKIYDISGPLLWIA